MEADAAGQARPSTALWPRLHALRLASCCLIYSAASKCMSCLPVLKLYLLKNDVCPSFCARPHKRNCFNLQPDGVLCLCCINISQHRLLFHKHAVLFSLEFLVLKLTVS